MVQIAPSMRCSRVGLSIYRRLMSGNCIFIPLGVVNCRLYPLSPLGVELWDPIDSIMTHSPPRFCSQCAPGTSTYEFSGDKYEGCCTRIKIQAENEAHRSSVEGAFCVGSGGMVKFCQSGEFIAVSHVWAQGWQGYKEDGLCSRVLDILLHAARITFDVRWIWLDVAMITRDRQRKM